MSAASHTPGRRIANTTFGRTVFCDPRAVRDQIAEEGRQFELRALLAGRIAVVAGCVIEPGTSEAKAAIAKATGATS